MAARLTRLTQWSVLKKNHLELTKLTASIYTGQRVESKNSYEKSEDNRQNNRVLNKFFTISLLASGFGYVLYKWKYDFWRQFDNFYSNAFSTVHAKSINRPDGRDKYNFIADVVEVTAPSVVYIEVKDHKRIDFMTGKPLIASNGSGFIVAEDGLILTNAHVVNKPNSTVQVRLHDGTTYPGKVEDVDTHSDLATIRINKKNLPVMKLGVSANIRPGEFVVAIGSPLALSNTITSGVVSSVSRPSEELGLYNKTMNYIQTDAAITFGNSGGPLVNLNGEAIGINAMKITAGISFAIPIDHAVMFLKKAEARRKGKTAQNVTDVPTRRYMGVTMLTITPDISLELQQKYGNIPNTVRHGVFIWKVIIGSPAYIGGLRAGDIITHINDEPIVTVANIYKFLEKAETLRLTVIRSGVELNLKVDPEETIY